MVQAVRINGMSTTSPFGQLQLLIGSHSDLEQAVNHERHDLIDDKPFKNHLGKMVDVYVNYGVAASICESAFVRGYSKRTPEENAKILATADKLLEEFSDSLDVGIGYAVDMAFGESLAYDIHEDKVPMSVDDLAKYAHLHKAVVKTMAHSGKSGLNT